MSSPKSTASDIFKNNNTAPKSQNPAAAGWRSGKHQPIDCNISRIVAYGNYCVTLPWQLRWKSNFDTVYIWIKRQGSYKFAAGFWSSANRPAADIWRRPRRWWNRHREFQCTILPPQGSCSAARCSYPSGRRKTGLPSSGYRGLHRALKNGWIGNTCRPHRNWVSGHHSWVSDWNGKMRSMRCRCGVQKPFSPKYRPFSSNRDPFQVKDYWTITALRWIKLVDYLKFCPDCL